MLEKIATVYTSLRVRAAIAQNPNVPIKLLKNLIEDDEYEIYLAAAKNPNTPIEIFQQLSQHNSSDIRIAVAQNPNTTLELLEILAKENDTSIRAAVLINPKLPLHLFEKLYSEISELLYYLTYEDFETLVERFSIDKPEFNTFAFHHRDRVYTSQGILPSFRRFVLLLHPQIPVNLLEKHKHSLQWRERYAITQNPSTPTEILQQLAEDANCVVRTAAQKKIEQQT